MFLLGKKISSCPRFNSPNGSIYLLFKLLLCLLLDDPIYANTLVSCTVPPVREGKPGASLNRLGERGRDGIEISNRDWNGDAIHVVVVVVIL